MTTKFNLDGTTTTTPDDPNSQEELKNEVNEFCLSFPLYEEVT